MGIVKTRLNQRTETTLGLGLAGVALTLMTQLWSSTPLTSHFFGAMLGLFLIGFFLRVMRRKLFFGPHHTLHQALSFDALFQGAVILNPQLPYPSVEQSFICRHSGLTPPFVQGWFSLRPTAAIAIPAALFGTTGLLADQVIIGLLGWCVCFLTIGLNTLSFQTRTAPWRFTCAMALGLFAVLGESFCWMKAGHTLISPIASWRLFLLYSVTLTVFEISPIPLGLGLIELSYLFIAYVLELPLITLALPLAYRLFRATPVVALTLFYLPRYKLSVLDLYNPDLFLALEKGWAPQAKIAHPSNNTRLSIIIPAYNEADRLPIYLPEVVKYCSSLPHPSEILIVDDGSTDNTASYVQSLAKKQSNLRLIMQPKNLGKGAAVRRGVLEAKGHYILFADADGATPIEEAEKMFRAIEQGGDVIIASRRLEDSQASRSLFRNLMGTFFFRLTSLLAVPGIADTQCGFKLFTQAAAKRLFLLMKEDSWAFDVELLYLAQKLGMVIREVPVKWTAIEGSKINPLQDAWKMFIALYRIRGQWKGLQNR